MKKTDSTVFVVRGNHDNPHYFTGNLDKEYVKMLPDYTILEINNLKILCVGGAVSIDRKNRNAYYGTGRDWWEDEVFEYKHDIVTKIDDVDIVITHSAPDFCYPYNKNNIQYWLKIDSNLEADLNRERTQVTYLYDQLYANGCIIKQWFYGHFHLSNEMYLRDTKFIALNIDEIKEINLNSERDDVEQVD
jgi:hypothetical protein